MDIPSLYTMRWSWRARADVKYATTLRYEYREEFNAINVDCRAAPRRNSQSDPKTPQNLVRYHSMALRNPRRWENGCIPKGRRNSVPSRRKEKGFGRWRTLEIRTRGLDCYSTLWNTRVSWHFLHEPRVTIAYLCSQIIACSFWCLLDDLIPQLGQLPRSPLGRKGNGNGRRHMSLLSVEYAHSPRYCNIHLSRQKYRNRWLELIDFIWIVLEWPSRCCRVGLKS